MASRGLLLMGQCMPCIKQNASKIRIRRMQLDKNLNMVGQEDVTNKYYIH